MLGGPRAFWLRVQELPGPGLLLLIHMESWKEIADTFGHEAVDIATGLFDAVCSAVTNNADAAARISTTVFCAFWRDEKAGQRVMEHVSRSFPVRVATPTIEFIVTGGSVTLVRTMGEPAANLYSRAQSEMERIVAALASNLRYPALPLSWEDLMKAPE